MVDFDERAQQPPGSGAGSSPDQAATATDLEQLRRQAARIQHEINNPLAALLAEAQLLLHAPLEADQRVAVEQIVELARKVRAKVQALDALRGDASPGER